MNISELCKLIGFNQQTMSLQEKLISSIGGFLGIFSIFMTSYLLLDPEIIMLIVPSMGATAVLLFAAPHLPFSQPWNVIAGHTFSAVVGIACWHWIPDYVIAASVSVSLAIGVMIMTRSIHPPGGATALAAVIGSEKLHSLGYNYVLHPILLNAITILAVAIVFNGLFKWRKYPAHLHFNKQTEELVSPVYGPINHEDFVYALSHIDTLVDIDEKDLLKIYNLATKNHINNNPANKKNTPINIS